MTSFTLSPVAHVRSPRGEARDDDWGGVIAEIVLDPSMPEEALDGIEDFSHAEIVFLFHQIDEDAVTRGARHPRNNHAWPAVGILAQRARRRPNRLGLTCARILERRGRVLRVEGLDAIDGTPVLDIKPVMRQFQPRGELRQPAWVDELMAKYWTG